MPVLEHPSAFAAISCQADFGMRARCGVKTSARRLPIHLHRDFLNGYSAEDSRGKRRPQQPSPRPATCCGKLLSPSSCCRFRGNLVPVVLIKVGEPSPRDRYLGSRSSQRILGPKGIKRISRSLSLGLTRSTGYQPKQPRSEGTPSCGCVVTRDAVRHGVAGLRPGVPVARRLR